MRRAFSEQSSCCGRAWRSADCLAASPVADRFLLHLEAQPGKQLTQRQCSQITIDAVAHGHRRGTLLLFADHQHVRYFLELGLADLIADFFRPVISSNPISAPPELRFDFPAI